MKLSHWSGGAALLLSLVGPLSYAAPAQGLESRRAALVGLLEQAWEHELRSSPEYASILGDKRYNDRLSERSIDSVAAELKASAAFLARFEAIDTSGFPEQEQLNKDLMVRNLRLELEGARFKAWTMPVLHNSGLHLNMPQLVSALPFDTVKDYDDYIARLGQLPRAFEQTITRMQQGVKDGNMPPKFVIPKIVEQCAGFAAMAPHDSPFAAPLAKFPASFSAADQARLSSAILAAIATHVNPAYRKFADYVQTEYLPHGRLEMGMWSLPDGQAHYRYRAKVSTTTDMTPEQIHQLGLSEVARIEGQMLVVAQKLGFKDLPSFNASLLTNPALHPTSRQHMVDLYSKYTEQMYARLPELFGILPKGKVEIMQVEQFREKGASAASYNQGTPDGSRPGRVMVNTSDFAKRSILNIETVALHEGVPGHHMQIAIAQELQGLPPFRTQGGYTAYVEGWALYSERLGQELGFFSDPYSFYGHLQDEMLRAIRLVVDTGLHDKKWTRQQVVDYFHAHPAVDEVEVQSETDRYIVWPGQALGYKIGQLKILELRRYAEQQLGKHFDIRAFHDQILGAGALPMDVLEKRIKNWVASHAGHHPDTKKHKEASI